jgi:hypothetical protein
MKNLCTYHDEVKIEAPIVAPKSFLVRSFRTDTMLYDYRCNIIARETANWRVFEKTGRVVCERRLEVEELKRQTSKVEITAVHVFGTVG